MARAKRASNGIWLHVCEREREQQVSVGSLTTSNSRRLLVGGEQTNERANEQTS